MGYVRGHYRRTRNGGSTYVAGHLRSSSGGAGFRMPRTYAPRSYGGSGDVEFSATGCLVLFGAIAVIALVVWIVIVPSVMVYLFGGIAIIGAGWITLRLVAAAPAWNKARLERRLVEEVERCVHGEALTVADSTRIRLLQRRIGTYS